MYIYIYVPIQHIYIYIYIIIYISIAGHPPSALTLISDKRKLELDNFMGNVLNLYRTRNCIAPT